MQVGASLVEKHKTSIWNNLKFPHTDKNKLLDLGLQSTGVKPYNRNNTSWYKEVTANQSNFTDSIIKYSNFSGNVPGMFYECFWDIRHRIRFWVVLKTVQIFCIPTGLIS